MTSRRIREAYLESKSTDGEKRRRTWKGKVELNGFMMALVGMFLLSEAALATEKPGIARIQSRPYGKSYPQWAAEWWTWAYKTPVLLPSGSHPVYDPKSEDCSVGQSGEVWFLAGTFLTNTQVERKCSVPAGTALFFPLVNSGWVNFKSDPPFTDQTCPEAALAFRQSFQDLHITAKIDGSKVADPLSYFALSPAFSVQLPIPTASETNLLDFWGVAASEFDHWFAPDNCGYGWWLFAYPLSSGQHSIEFKVKNGRSTVQDVHYELTVLPHH